MSVFVQDLPKSTIALFDKQIAKYAVPENGSGGRNPSVLLHESFTGPPPCHIPMEALSNIPTFRLSNLDDGEIETDNNEVINDSSSETGTRDSKNLPDLPTPCAVTCSRKRFLNCLQGAEGGETVLEKLNLVLFDNAHEALRSNLVRTQLLEAVNLIR